MAPVFLDSENLTDLRGLEQHVVNTLNLVLLLTPGVLSRPWCLVEIVTAIRNGINIVPVDIQRPGLRFEFPKDDGFYKQQLQMLSALDVDMIQAEGIEIGELDAAMRHVFKQIALPFSPHKSKGVRDAELADVLKRCSLAP